MTSPAMTLRLARRRRLARVILGAALLVLGLLLRAEPLYAPIAG